MSEAVFRFPYIQHIDPPCDRYVTVDTMYTKVYSHLFLQKYFSENLIVLSLYKNYEKNIYNHKYSINIEYNITINFFTIIP